MHIRYTHEEKITSVQLAAVFESSGIRRPTSDLPRIQRMIDAADLLVTAWDGDTLVGVARALTDFSYCCYLSDLAVARDYQHQGIGKELVSQVHELIGSQSMLLLLAAPEAQAYYPKIGMEAVHNGWIINRRG